MGRRGPAPKDPRVRQRTNRPEELIQLPSLVEAAGFEVPPMPKPPKGKKRWAEPVVEWWHSIWKSPMSTMWTQADVRSVVHELVRLRQFLYDAKGSSEYVRLMVQIQRMESQLGLSPLDRLRLRWEIRSGRLEREDDEDAVETRTVGDPDPDPAPDDEDPRRALESQGKPNGQVAGISSHTGTGAAPGRTSIRA